jgi:type IV pilus assembly protein PilY1
MRGRAATPTFRGQPSRLEEKLNESFSSILQRTSSGTAASVISGSRTGEGALFQALFYPSQTDSYGNTLLWSGQLYSLFVDHYGNFREDTNTNASLDMGTDRIVNLYFDENQAEPWPFPGDLDAYCTATDRSPRAN